MMAPILESSDPPAAREHARQLGLAFQLTNFIRDSGEDLKRGRVYLPPGRAGSGDGEGWGADPR
jgi:15-cis-phytoene synthase